ncbi:choice-of-anchor G family protein [Microbacterium betulae]|uniref:Choice-of-anchor G family protein n=1 Tax=Microbacterium betulae TaxID=2981139 RepID=A0AA97FII8_9MICO|nr:choice-of-anchor G family protein [Microbacterium sp. AB]WOF22674.1 choice-of-anchor G family protein [Microbacterium sp. AB]
MTAANALESDDSEALGQVIASDVLGADLLAAASSASGNPSDPGPNATPINLELLGGLTVDLGGGLALPLITSGATPGLLDLGEVGALSSYASSETGTTSTASAGAIGADGALAIDADNTGEFGPATVNLTDVLDQVGVAGLTDEIVDNLALEIGAVASTATSEEGVLPASSEYVVAGADLYLSSPLVATLQTSITDAVSLVGTTVDTAVGEGGVLDTALGGLETTINSTLGALGLVTVEGPTLQVNDFDSALDTAVATIITEPLFDGETADDSIVVIDLESGLVTVQLENLVDGGLNGQDPNTEVLSSEAVSAVTTAVSDALGSVTGKVTEAVTEVLDLTGVLISLDVDVSADLGILIGTIPVASGAVTIDTTLGQLAGTDTTDPVIDADLSVLDGLSDVPGIGALIDTIVNPLISTVLSALTDTVVPLVLDTLEPVVQTLFATIGDGLSEAIGDVLEPVITVLDPVFDALNLVVAITINEQPTERDPAEEGYLGAESFTVNALSLEFLPTLGAVNLDLGSSTVRSAAVVYDTAITLTPSEVEAGGTTTIEGSGFAPNETVTITIGDETITAETDENGDFSTDYTVPEGTDPGTLDVVAEGEVSQTPAEAELTVIDGDDNGNVNASSSAAASANADDDSNAAAQAAAQAAADADANTTASAAADADATAAAQVAANADASSDASADVSSEANASAQAAAQAASDANADSASNADASAAAEGNASAASAAAANADSSSDASSGAAADASADADDSSAADASASADADDSSSTDTDASASSDSDSSASTDSDASASADADDSSSADADSSASVDSDASASADADDSSAADADASASSDSDSSASASADADSSASADSDSDADGAGIRAEIEHETRFRGEEQLAYGYGFEPGEEVEATVYSTPTSAGVEVADANGEVTFVWTVAQEEEIGQHHVELVGETSGTADAVYFRVLERQSDLAPTGGDPGLPIAGLAALMVLGGAGVWVISRRRGASA